MWKVHSAPVLASHQKGTEFRFCELKGEIIWWPRWQPNSDWINWEERAWLWALSCPDQGLYHALNSWSMACLSYKTRTVEIGGEGIYLGSNVHLESVRRGLNWSVWFRQARKQGEPCLIRRDPNQLFNSVDSAQVQHPSVGRPVGTYDH
jgi:hypothetical protein